MYRCDNYPEYTDYGSPYGPSCYQVSSYMDDTPKWFTYAIFDDDTENKLLDTYDAVLHLRYSIPETYKIRCISRDFDYACNYYLKHIDEPNLRLSSPDIHVNLVLEDLSL